jgi:hypothetical protein
VDKRDQHLHLPKPGFPPIEKRRRIFSSSRKTTTGFGWHHRYWNPSSIHGIVISGPLNFYPEYRQPGAKGKACSTHNDDAKGGARQVSFYFLPIATPLSQLSSETRMRLYLSPNCCQYLQATSDSFPP